MHFAFRPALTRSFSSGRIGAQKLKVVPHLLPAVLLKLRGYAESRTRPVLKRNQERENGERLN